MIQPPWPPGHGPDYGQGPPSRIRPPWRDAGARRTELMVWAAVGLVAWILAPLLAYLLVVGIFADGEAGVLAAILLAAAMVLGAIIASVFGPPRVRAVGYGVLAGVGLVLALVALALIVAAGLCVYLLSNN